MLLISGLSAAYGLKNLAFYLSQSKPINAQLLIVEGWIEIEDLAKVKALIDASEYQHVLVVGGKIYNACFESDPSYGERGRRILVEMGVDESFVSALTMPDSKQERTFTGAVFAREWNAGQAKPYDRIELLTADVHARRSLYLFELAFHDSAKVGVIPLDPRNYTLDQWWQNSLGAKAVISESAAWIWTRLFFNPGEKGSKWEKWGV